MGGIGPSHTAAEHYEFSKVGRSDTAGVFKRLRGDQALSNACAMELEAFGRGFGFAHIEAIDLLAIQYIHVVHKMVGATGFPASFRGEASSR
jgi:hypothetical protein